MDTQPPTSPVAAADQASIVFTGSSIMALWESLPQFFPGIPIINTAIGGSQTHEIYAQLDALVVAHAPRCVCYYCGSNDINGAVAASTIADNVVRTYAALRQRLDGVAFVFLSIIKAPQKQERWDVVDEANARLRQLAAELEGFWYLELNPVFFTPDGQPRMEFYLEDQLHLTPPAYLALGERMAPRVLEILGGQAKKDAD